MHTHATYKNKEEAVFVLPGACFGADNFFRVVFTAPVDKLAEAYERIVAFTTAHLK
jgi:tyrosine aminotransferase